MENNVNFRNDFRLEYLNQLARYQNTEEFLRVYQEMESYLVEQARVSTDVVTLEKINAILAYRKKSMELQL